MNSSDHTNVLLIDDTAENLRMLSAAVASGGYRVRAASSGVMGLRMARAERPDLILLDIDMPGMDGFEVCDRLQQDEQLASVPVIFLTALSDAETKVEAFSRGGRDFVTKPFQIDEVIARIATHMKVARLEAQLNQQNARLEERVAAQVHEISEAQMATIVALAKLSQSRDDTTGLHVERIGGMCEHLARAVLDARGGQDAEMESLVPVIGGASMLHDIGKVGIADAILLKPGGLTPDEFAVMKTHAMIGANTLAAVLSSYPANNFVRVGMDIARSHHERWDGSGYPDRLAGEAIPMSARLVALVDVYDALRSKRPYKAAMSHDDATAFIHTGFGKHFDPGLEPIFAAHALELDRIFDEMQGEAPSSP